MFVGGLQAQMPLPSPINGNGGSGGGIIPSTTTILRGNGTGNASSSNLTQNSDGSNAATKAFNVAAPSGPTFNSGGTTTVDLSLANGFTVTMTGDTTFSFSNPHGMGPYVAILKQDTPGHRSAVYPASMQNCPAPNAATQSLDTLVFQFWYDGSANYYCEGSTSTGLLALAPVGTPCTTTPPVGYVCSWFDSTDLTLELKNSNGTIYKLGSGGGGASVGLSGAVQTSDGAGGFLDGGCTMAASVQTCGVAQPTDSPGMGTYSSTQSVTLNTATPGAAICWTGDGSAPAAATPGTCSHGTTYSGAITVSSTTTIKALGTKSGLVNSSTLTATYTITGGGGSPAFVSSEDGFPNVGTGGTFALSAYNVVAGNSLWIVAGSRGVGCAGTQTVADTALNTFTSVSTISNGFTCTRSFRASGVTGNANDVIVLTDTGGFNWGIVVLQVSGVTAIDQTSASTGTGSAGTNSATPVTTTSTNEAIVCGIFDYYESGTDTITAGSGYTLITPLNGPGLGLIAAEYQIVNSTGSYSCPFNITGNNYTSIGLGTFQ